MRKMTLNEMTQKERVLHILTRQNRQNTLTVRQARKDHNIANVRAVVSSLRRDGFEIQTRFKTNRDGAVELFYAL